MTKAELVRESAKRAGLTIKATEKVLNAVEESIKATLGKGDKVVLVGFGTFAVARRADRTGRDPRTGAAIRIPAHRVPIFRAGKGLKETV
ncbi:MAG TPA: HU family DNA-binding protein [Symbiobacteriaceae bacterium]|nr:HU family DNA-binding protein [Symbiobacteriaceae bacterium]